MKKPLTLKLDKEELFILKSVLVGTLCLEKTEPPTEEQNLFVSLLNKLNSI